MKISTVFFFILLVVQQVSASLTTTITVPPANVRCGDGESGYGLYWTDKSVDENKFNVYQAVNSLSEFKLLTQVKSTSKATEGTTYFWKIEYHPENFYSFKVTSVGPSGESKESGVTILPKRPTDFSASADSISVTIQWTIPADSWIQMMFVERSTSPDSGFQIMSPIVSNIAVRFFDFTAIKGIAYYYRIRGVYYDGTTRNTSYTTPSQIVGPMQISGPTRDCDGVINCYGRNYKYKNFGNQTWMIENLAYLPEVNPSDSVSISDRRYYVYGYQGSDVSAAKATDNYRSYGVLYNWQAASEGMSINSSDSIGVQGICPAGWHLPSNKEWHELQSSLAIAKMRRDSTYRALAFKKYPEGLSAKPSDLYLALPDFKEFAVSPGGYLQGDSSKFLAVGEAENYWSSTSRILFDRGYRSSDIGKGYGFPVRCLKGAALPIIQTEDIAGITKTTAQPGGNISRDGGAPITDRGVCISTLESPNACLNRTSCGADAGQFKCSLDGLAEGTIYFIRAYATNSVGTAYGAEKQFVTAGKGALPTVFTGNVFDVLGTTAAVGGSFTTYGGSAITARGICWNTKKNPTVTDNKATSVSGLSIFNGYLAGLKPLTTYYVRAYAVNSFGTSYGEERQFTTSGEVQDGYLEYEGRKYAYKTIGSQTWMTENLAYLPAVSPTALESKDKPVYYVYGYEGVNIDSAKANANYANYGVLYNWVAAKTACPSGWHLPEQEEMNKLIAYLTNYGYGYGGGGTSIAKSMATTTGWEVFALPGTIGKDPAINNKSGFSAVSAGQRIIATSQQANGAGKVGVFWSSSTYGREDRYAYSLALIFSNNTVQPYPTDKRHGFSVRCVKDK